MSNTYNCPPLCASCGVLHHANQPCDTQRAGLVDWLTAPGTGSTTRQGALSAFHAATCADLVDFLVAETSEDAVFCFISAISCFGITDREDAIVAMEKDPDTRRWAVMTASLIPEPYAQRDRW